MSSTLARTDRRLAELQAVADGERGRLYFSKGAWLVGTTGDKVEAGQARTLTELMNANLIMTTRRRWNGPIMAELTVAGREALQSWRTEPTGDAARGEALLNTIVNDRSRSEF